MSWCDGRGDSAGFVEGVCGVRRRASGDGFATGARGAYRWETGNCGQTGVTSRCGTGTNTSCAEARWRRDVCVELVVEFDFGSGYEYGRCGWRVPDGCGTGAGNCVGGQRAAL